MNRTRPVWLVLFLHIATTPAPAVILINEVLFDAPVGSDDGQEYFEILSTEPNQPLDGLRLLVLNGDAGGAGEIDDVISLNSLYTGANGLLLSREGGTPTFPLIEFTPQPDPQTAVDIAGRTSFTFKNTQAISLLLVSGFTGSNGDDLDADDNGVLDSAPWETVLDAISILDPSDPSYDYATQAGGQSFATLSYSPDLIFRDAVSREWIAADVIAEEVEEPQPGGPYLLNPDEISTLTGEALTLSAAWTPGVTNPTTSGDAPRPGDFNGDGSVNAADYTMWRDNLGGPESAIHNNGDGLDGVDAKDYELWKQWYGAGTDLLEANKAPEPGGGLLTACCVLVCGLACRRTRARAPRVSAAARPLHRRCRQASSRSPLGAPAPGFPEKPATFLIYPRSLHTGRFKLQLQRVFC